MTYSDLLERLQQALHGDRPVLLVLAGSNGAGKTTFYELYLERLGLPFINADRIAQILNPADPARLAYQAADLAANARQDLIDHRHSFCMETVFSDPVGDKVQFLRDAQAAGYVVIGLFIQLSDQMLSCARVAQRVARGGHDVPDDKLLARFARTHRNIHAALQPELMAPSGRAQSLPRASGVLGSAALSLTKPRSLQRMGASSPRPGYCVPR